MPGTIGLDIGGANLKAAHQDRVAITRPFALWRFPDQLADALTELLSELPFADRLAVTMTGELADCYASKAEGVTRILDAVTKVADNRSVVVWQTGAEFLTVEEAKEFPRLVAAANWHALATFVGRIVPDGRGLLLDIGSTTTDLIPLRNGLPDHTGLTDPERLQSGELLYTGCRRTPVCAIATSIPGETTDLDAGYTLAAELFATIGDVYLIAGALREHPDDTDTADGRPFTTPHARQRLARMVCADQEELADGELDRIASEIANRHRRQLQTGLQRILDRDGSPSVDPIKAVILSGSGVWLAGELIENSPELATAETLRFDQQYGEKLASAACAYAVCRLAVERCSSTN